ncbi:TIGR03086 family metal-binding protein [Actinomycetospora endophytica]|uniref:TIGR03086 family metal-binding protein n=1 Tax=Actinomycetospora endophytica TaxID=2291215 RepID=A0ABS8PBZ1_9PSEU|nr:TIGR03086 family metal-binding protein [Actinomycetospora endophytica]MCD2194936.1 TIGR03086 family metal-binding protein [Actinomycetospora endophytica]
MQTNAVAVHRRALDVATSLIRDVRTDQLSRPSPCAGWDLRALLEHMVGQNHGFADAVESAAGVPVAAFAPRAFTAAAWEASAERVAAAFEAAPGEREVLLVEISPERRFPVSTALRFHLLDTVVHTWDVATTVGLEFRPDDDLAQLVHAGAAAVPTGPGREAPGAAFAPPLDVEGDDPWMTTLALLGRSAA